MEYDRIPRYYPSAGPACFPLNLTTSGGVNSLQQAFFGGASQLRHGIYFRALKNSASPDKKVSLHVLSQKLLHNSEPTVLAKPLKVPRAVV